MSIAEKLLAAGAVEVKELTFNREREKVSGAMWNGRTELKLGDVIFYLKMWHHFHEDRDMTREEALGFLTLDAIRCLKHEPRGSSLFSKKEDGAFYDAGWYVLVTKTKILLNRNGWIKDVKLGELVRFKQRKLSVNSIEEFTKQDEQELLKNGFEILLAF